MFPCNLIWKILIGKAFLFMQVVNENQNATSELLFQPIVRGVPRLIIKTKAFQITWEGLC